MGKTGERNVFFGYSFSPEGMGLLGGRCGGFG